MDTPQARRLQWIFWLKTLAMLLSDPWVTPQEQFEDMFFFFFFSLSTLLPYSCTDWNSFPLCNSRMALVIRKCFGWTILLMAGINQSSHFAIISENVVNWFTEGFFLILEQNLIMQMEPFASYLKYFSRSTTTRLRILPGLRLCWSCTQDVRVGPELPPLTCLSSCVRKRTVVTEISEWGK